MEAMDSARCGLAPEQQEKVAQIFRKCDEDKDGVLRKEELMSFMRAVNPCVDWTETQWRLIVDEVSERYRCLWKSGLTQRGLEKTYEDGYGDVDNDYETLFWAEQDHPQEYWQDAHEDFWEDPVSSPDRVNPSPAASPAKESSREPTSDVQQGAVSNRDAVKAAKPGHKAAAEAQAPQPASSASQDSPEQVTLDVEDILSEPMQSQQVAAGEEVREEQQSTSNVEEAVRLADPGHQVLAGEGQKKQPSDVPVAYPMIVHAGAVPSPPSRQTSSEFLASIAGNPQFVRPSRSAAAFTAREVLHDSEGLMTGVHPNPALPIIRAQSDQHLNAAITLNSLAHTPHHHTSGNTAAIKHEAEPATPRTAITATRSAAGDEAQAEAAQSARPLMSEPSPALGAQPVSGTGARSPRAGPQPADTTSPVGEAVESARVALSDESQAGVHVAGSPALASIRTRLLPGSMARILADSGSEVGQSGTPASHRISDVGSEEADEAVTSPAGCQAGASSRSRPATPAAAHLTPRTLSRNSSGQGSPGWGMHAALRILSERPDLAAYPVSSALTAGAVSFPAGSRLAKQTSDAVDQGTQSALAVGTAPAEERGSEDNLVPDEALEALSMQGKAQKAKRGEGGAESAPAGGNEPLEEPDSGRGLMPDEARAPSMSEDKAVAAAQDDGGVDSAHADMAAQSSSGSPTAGPIRMPRPSQSAAGSRLAKQTSAGADAIDHGANSALSAGAAPAKERGLKEGLVPDEALKAPSMQGKAQKAAWEVGGAEAAPAKGSTPLEEQASERPLMPNEAVATTCTAQQAEAAAQDSGAAESALAAGSASANERDKEEALMPNKAVATTCIAWQAEAAAQDGGGAESALASGNAPANERDTGEALMPDEAVAIASTDQQAEAAAQDEEGAEAAFVMEAVHAMEHGSGEGTVPDDGLGDAPEEKQDSEEGLVPDEALATPSRQEKAEAAAQEKEGAESARSIGDAPAGEQASGAELLPDEAMPTQSSQEVTTAIAQSAALPQSDTALLSMQEKAQAAAQEKGGAESAGSVEDALSRERAPAAGLLPGEAMPNPSMQDSAEVTAQSATLPQSNAALLSMQKKAEAAAQEKGGAESAGRVENAKLLPDEAMPHGSMLDLAETHAQDATLSRSDTALFSSHTLEPRSGSEPAAHVSRKRNRPGDLEKLEETEKPARGSAARLGNTAQVAENAQERVGVPADYGHDPATLSNQRAASFLEGLSPVKADALLAETQLIAADSPLRGAHGVSRTTEMSSSGTPALPALQAATPDAVAASAPGTAEVYTEVADASDLPALPAAAPDAVVAGAPGTAEVYTEAADASSLTVESETVRQTHSSNDTAPGESSTLSATGPHVQESQPLPQAEMATHSATGREASIGPQVPAHAVEARKLASAELLCDEALPDTDYGLPWHETAEAAFDGLAKANGRSRLGQPPSLSHAHDSLRCAAANVAGPAATNSLACADAFHTGKPVAGLMAASEGAVTLGEVGAAQDAADDASGAVQPEAQPTLPGRGAVGAAPEQDASGQASTEQPGSAPEASPRIAAALLKAGSRITVRAAKPKRATLDAHSNPAAAPEAAQDSASAGTVPAAETALGAEVTERMKDPSPIKVPPQPEVSGSHVTTPSRQGLSSPIRFLSRALSSINLLKRGPEDTTPRAFVPPTRQGLAPYAEAAESQLERQRPSPLRVDTEGLAAAPIAVQSHAVEVSPSPATTAGTQSPDSRLPSPARPAQPQVPNSLGPGQDLQSGTTTTPRIGREPAADAKVTDAPAEQAVALQACSDGAGPDGGAEPESETSGVNAAEHSRDVSRGAGAQEAKIASGTVTADAPAEQRTLTEADDSKAAFLQASGRQTAQMAGVEVHNAQEEAGLAKERGDYQSKAAPPAFWKSISGLFAASGAGGSPQPPRQERPSKKEPAVTAATAMPCTPISAQGVTLDSAQLHPPRLCEDEPTRQPEPTLMPQRPQPPNPPRLVATLAPSGETAPEPATAAAHAGSLAAVPEAPPAEALGSCDAMLALSEAEEVRSPERMGANRPPIVVTSPFAVAALQAQCGLDPKTAEAIEAAIMSPKKGLIAHRQAAQGRGLQPMSAASALEGLQAELAEGDLPSPGSPTPEDLCLLGRPPAKLPSLGRPPLSHATAETAVATLKESRLKVELQKGLEECKVELGASRQAAKGSIKALKDAGLAKCADSGQAGKGSATAPETAGKADPTDSDHAAEGIAMASESAGKAEPTDSDHAAKEIAMAPESAGKANAADSSQAAKGAPQAAAAKPRLPAAEVSEESTFQASETLPRRGRPALRSPPASGKSQGPGSAAARADTPTPRSKTGTPPLPPHQPPAAVRQSFFALPTSAGSPEQPRPSSSDIACVISPPQQPGHAQQRPPPRTVAGPASPGPQRPCASPEASAGRAASEGADTPAFSNASSKRPASSAHRRVASASAAEHLGLQTGMSLLDTQNLDEMAGTSKQPAFQRAMSMLSTMGSLGTLTCPVVPPAWSSTSEDEHSASSGADSCATSGDSDIISASLSSTHVGSRAARVASDRDSEQDRSAGAALEAGRVQREATAVCARADVRPVFMKALQILTSGRLVAEAKPVEGVSEPPPSPTEPAAARHVSVSASAPLAQPEANSGAAGSLAARDSSASRGLAALGSAVQPEPCKSPGGYRPRRLSAAAQPFIPGAPSPTSRACAGRPLSSVPWQSPNAPWMRKAASPAPASPQPDAASQESTTAPPPAGNQPQKPGVSSFEGPSRLAPEDESCHGAARSSVPALYALPGALSNADELASEGAVAGIEAGPSHNPCQRLDFGEAQNGKEEGMWGKLQALRDYHTASEEKEAQEIYEDLEVPILATHEVADIVEAVQKMQAPYKISAALGGGRSAAGPSRFEAPSQEQQQGLTGQQASLLSWFSGKLADVASEQQVPMQETLSRRTPTHVQDAQKEAGSGSNGGLSQAAVAPRLQQSEEVVGMFGSETAARSGLLSSYSEMPDSAVNHQRQVMKGSVSEGDGLLDTNATADGDLMATPVSLFPDPLQTANSEMLFNTVDPLSSINSTMNIHDTFEGGQAPVPGKQAAVRQQQKRSAPGDLLTTAIQCFDEDAARSRPASAALPAAPARPEADAQTLPLEQAEKAQEGAASSREKEGGREQRVSNCARPGETLGSVLESAKQAVSGAAPGSSLSHAMEELHGSIAQLSATDQFAAHMAIGSLLTTKGCHEEAAGSFEAAVRVNPTSARVHFHLGNVQFALQQFAAAETSFHTALKVLQLPTDGSLRPKIHVNLGITVEADGRLLAACHHYQTALDYDPVHYRARKLLGSARYALGDLPAARDALRFALTQCPEYADAQCDLGCTLCAMNKVEEAKASFEAAIRIMPNHLEALFNLANLQRQCGEFEAAVRSYERVLELSPDSWRGLLNYSVALVGLGRELEAKQALRRAFRLSGYSGKVTEEIEKLRRMAQRGDRQRLGTLMKDISQIVAEEVVEEQPGLKPRRLWGLRSPQRTTSKQLSIGTPGSNILDTGLLHQLRVVCALRPSALLNLTKDGSLKDLQIQGVGLVAAETIMRRLLPELPALRFQHLMRVICHEILHHIQEDHPTRDVDVGMMLALLAAVSRASCEERLAVAYRLLIWQSGCRLLPRRLAVAYVRLLKACFGSKYNKHEVNKWAVEHFEDNAELSQADFAMLFSFPVFAALQEYGQDSTSG